jgi:putative ABC transport system permease protein
VAEDLFAGRPAVGEEIRIKDQRFIIIGVVSPPKDDKGEDPRICYVPYQTALDRLGANPLDAELLLAAPSVERIGEIKSDLERLLPHLHPGIGLDSYEVETAEEDLKNVYAEARMQALILGGVALLSMLAAGGGILNTLLVGVKERTREIGVRRAIGARRGTILRQFLAEAVVLAIPGSLLGLATGVGVAKWLGAILASGLDGPSILVIAIGRRETFAAAGVAVMVASLAGLWPAWQAAAIPPAEALRYE